MSTLWKRASGPQFRMLRIVSGAVLDAANAHPHKVPDKSFARSVAKRAVGTISSQWAELLAAETKVDPLSGKRPVSLSPGRNHRSPATSDGGGRPQFVKADPFAKLCHRLGKMITPLRLSGDTEAVDAIREAIKAIAPLVRREQGKARL